MSVPVCPCDSSDSVCVFDDGTRGTSAAVSNSGIVEGELGCVFALLCEVGFDSSSRSKELNCTTTSPTWTLFVTSSHVDPVTERSGDEGSSWSSTSPSSSSSSLGSSLSLLTDPSISSSFSSESSKPSCALARATFLR